ncbi:PCRF domain-containing protein [Leptolyngbya sp. 7M]|nr:PCRF domain-containing protein [Leptolyngbya sp. 7M]
MEQQISDPNFWNDQANAQKIVQERSRVEKALEKHKGFEIGISDAEVLFEFAAEDADSAKELESLILRLEKEVKDAEVESLLSGETDANNAICSLQAGAGGTDAQDFCQMLLRMYLRWAEKRGFRVELLDEHRQLRRYGSHRGSVKNPSRNWRLDRSVYCDAGVGLSRCLSPHRSGPTTRPRRWAT